MSPRAGPQPLSAAECAPFLAAIERGAGWRAALEELLLALDAARADELMQLLREARAAWFPLLAHSLGELLFVGDALSGAITPLAAAGFAVTALERDNARARMAQVRAAAHPGQRVRVLRADLSARLPFEDGAFDVVVCEDGARAAGALTELRRVCRGELVLTADNRLAYKRSSGRRGGLRVPRPLEFARDALAPARGERTLAGYRRLLRRGGFERVRAYALYPHARDFTHVVGLDERLPELTIGPRERANHIKVAARALGLFPLFTPSFALIASRTSANARARIERVLDELANRTGEPRPVAEQLVATRGNTLVVHTRAGAVGEPGAWTLHVSLGVQNVPQFELHVRTLRDLRARFPSVPAPEALADGRFDGLWLTCERRLRGWTTPQLLGEPKTVGRALRESAEHLARLVTRPAQTFTADDFEAQVERRARIAAQRASETTRANLRRLCDEARAGLVGARLPLVLYHGDLRGKHVQVDEDGGVLGFLDWGTTEAQGLPLFDLLHLVVHERKQERGLTVGEAWREVRDARALLPHEREALARYQALLGIEDGAARAITTLYPLLVAAVAEANWDYSRPRWLERQFGL